MTIRSVIAGSASARVGLCAGDLIVAAEELPIRASADLMEVLSTKRPGDVVTFEIKRGAAELRVKFPLGKRPSVEGAAASAPPAVAAEPAAPGRPARPARPARPEGSNAAEAPSSGFFFEPAKPAAPTSPEGTNADRAPGSFWLDGADDAGADADLGSALREVEVESLLREIEVMERRLAELQAELEELRAAMKRVRRR